VVIENDANALAVAEKCFGLARDSDQFASVTLGTGIGGGCYIGGRLNRGANFFANALGHLTIEPNGDPCTCGRKGCLEAYANAAALLRYADRRFRSAEALIEAANGGDAGARKAIKIYAGYLARGCSLLVQMIDPQQIILSGGIAQNNPLLVEALERELAAETPVWKLRHLQIGVSNLGYHGGVLGAAAVALSHLEEQGQ
jgi:predicted NBD/HSP70 family sugar kinase